MPASLSILEPMVRGLLVLVFGLTFGGQALGQIYFDNLYQYGDRVEGISIEGTVKLSDGYLSWVYTSPVAESYGNVGLLMTDFAGNMIGSYELPLIDTIRERVRNIIALDDTTLIALSFEQVLTESTPGDMVLRKLNRNGLVDWKQTYGDSGRLDVAQRLARTNDGGFIMAGQITIEGLNGQEADGWLVKADANGNQQWEQTYGGSDYDAISDVIQTADGGYLSLGWARSFGTGQRDFYLIKTDSAGNEQWHETYGGAGEDVGSSILRLTNGNYLLTGGGTNAAVTTAKGFLYEVTPSGQQVWHQEYASGPSEGDHLFMSVQLADGSIVSCGVADNNGTGGNAGWLVKTDANGDLLWQREYDKNQYTDLFYSLLATDDGGFLLSGQAVNEQTNSQDAWLLKVDSVGCTFPNCITGIDEAGSKEIVVDVWPNPATDVLNIEKLDPSTSLRVTAYDLSGREILRFTQNTRRSTIDVSNWPNGVYPITGVDKEGRVFSVKVVKE